MASLELKINLIIIALLIPTIIYAYSLNKNLKELKIGVSGLSDNIRNYKIDNNELQNLHNEFVAELDDLVKNLDKSINNKIEILENYNCVSAFVKLITYDDTKTSEINENIDKINKLYKEINSFYTK